MLSKCYGLPARNTLTPHYGITGEGCGTDCAAALFGFLEITFRGLAEALLEVGADGLDELGAVDGLGLNTFHQVHGMIISQE